MKKSWVLVLCLTSCVDRDPVPLPLHVNPCLSPAVRKQDSGAPTPASPPRAAAPAKGGTLAWKVSLPGGRPLATPAYAGGRLYLGGGFGSTEFYCLDADTGKTAWVFKTGDDGPTAAVVDEDCVVFNTESCTIYTLDLATGKPLWSKWLGDPLLSQPALAKGRVYMAYPGQDAAHHLICLGLKDGKQVWDAKIAGDALAAPVLEGTFVYVTSFDGTVHKYEAATGKLLWSEQRGATSAPWIWGDSVLVSQGGERDPGGEVRYANVFRSKMEAQLMIQGSGGDLRGRVLEKSDQAADYLDPKKQRGTGGMVLSNHLESADDEAVHQLQGDTAVGFASAPPSAKLDVAEKNVGVKTVCGAWAYQGSRPSVAGGRCFAAMGEVLLCHDLRTGRILWEKSFKPSKPIQGMRLLNPPALANGKIFLSTAMGEVLCLNSGGDLLWTVNAGQPMAFPPIVVKGRVFVATSGGQVLAIETGDERDDGWPMWGGSAAHNGPQPRLRMEPQ